MKKPNLNDFNLTEESLKKQQKKRFKWKFVIIMLSILVLVANYRFWLWADAIIGTWCILGLVLTFWGLIPAAFSYALLDIYLGKWFYKGLHYYEDAKKQYDQWFVKTQFSFWDALTGRQFEHEVTNLLNKAGYSAEVTPSSGDKGVDVLLADRTIVQCKAHKSRVSPSVARELYGTLQHFKAPRAILISKSGFSKGVYEFVQGKNITLWDVNNLIDMQRSLAN